MFFSKSTHQIDEKGRIRIPTRFKDELGKNPFITCGSNKCLFVYSAEEAQRVFLDKFQNSDFASSEYSKAVRLFMSNAIVGEEDKQGRILLPQHLLAHAEIKKNIVTIGALNHMEIWSEENWTAYISETDIDETLKLLKKENA